MTLCSSSRLTAYDKRLSSGTPARAAYPASHGCCRTASAREAPDWSPRRRRTPAPAGTPWPPAPGRASTARPTTPSTRTATPSPTAPPRSTRACCRPRRSPSPRSGAARRSRRSSGPAGATPRSTGPTVDFRTFLSGRGVATNYVVRRRDDAGFIAAFGLQFDHPDGFAGQAPFAEAAPHRRTGWSNVPTSYSPAQEMRLRVLDSGVDKYGLNAYLYDSTDDATTQLRPGAVLADQGRRRRRRRPARGRVGRRQGHDRRRRPSTARPPACWSRSSRCRADLSEVRLFHTSVTRATPPGRPGPASPASPAPSTSSSPRGSRPPGRRLRHPGGRHRQRGDVRRAGAVLGDALPSAAQVRHRDLPAGPGAGRLPGHRRVPAPVPRPGHQEAAERRPNPAYDDVQVDGTPDGRVGAARGFIRAPTRAPTRPCGSRRSCWAAAT